MMRFLILEDDPILLPQVQRILEMAFAGARVATATTSKDALDLLTSSLADNQPYDAAIIACCIPADRTSFPDIEYSLGEAFGESSPETILVHFTAFADASNIRNELIKRGL